MAAYWNQIAIGCNHHDALSAKHHVKQVGIALTYGRFLLEHVIWFVADIAVGVFYILVKGCKQVD